MRKKSKAKLLITSDREDTLCCDATNNDINTAYEAGFSPYVMLAPNGEVEYGASSNDGKRFFALSREDYMAVLATYRAAELRGLKDLVQEALHLGPDDSVIARIASALEDQ